MQSLWVPAETRSDAVVGRRRTESQIATDVRQMYFIDANTIIYPVESVKDCEITTTPNYNRLQIDF